MMCGCGGGGDSTATTVTSAFRKAQERAEAAAPKGASPLLREIYGQFPPPKPDPKVKGSGKAIEAGERACKGKTPLEVREAYVEESDLLADQAKMVGELEKYEGTSKQTASFVAGQLGALVYERTLPEGIARYGYQGCVYSLARGLEHSLAPR
jgi:hypothetical protein